MSGPSIILGREGRPTTVTMDRPASHDALNAATRDELAAAGCRAEQRAPAWTGR